MENDIEKLKNFLIENPNFILNDIDILNSLLSSIPKKTGKNVVDLRSIFSERLEEKYSNLEKTHRNVVAAAHDNISTVKSINRAVLKILQVNNLVDFLEILNSEIKPIFKLASIFLCFDSIEPLSENWPDHKCLHLMKEGECYKYFDLEPGAIPLKNILLRKIKSNGSFLNNADNTMILSEAVIAISLSDSKDLALLTMGSTDPDYFNPNQATDLLSFFGGVLERHLNNIMLKSDS